MTTLESKVFEVHYRQTTTIATGAHSLVVRRISAAYYQNDGPWLIFKNPLHKPVFQVNQELVETIEEIPEREDDIAARVQRGEMSINQGRKALGHAPWPQEFADRRYDWRFKEGPVLVDKS